MKNLLKILGINAIAALIVSLWIPDLANAEFRLTGWGWIADLGIFLLLYIFVGSITASVSQAFEARQQKVAANIVSAIGKVVGWMTLGGSTIIAHQLLPDKVNYSSATGVMLFGLYLGMLFSLFDYFPVFESTHKMPEKPSDPKTPSQ